MADRPWYDPKRDPVTRMLEIGAGDDDVTEGEQLTLDVRRDCDLEYLRRTEAFVRRNVADETPFFVYFNHSLMHMPVIPREEFKGVSGQGDWADALLELDADFGRLLDLLDELEVADGWIVSPSALIRPPWRRSQMRSQCKAAGVKLSVLGEKAQALRNMFARGHQCTKDV